jgi:hypothetical protein
LSYSSNVDISPESNNDTDDINDMDMGQDMDDDMSDNDSNETPEPKKEVTEVVKKTTKSRKRKKKSAPKSSHVTPLKKDQNIENNTRRSKRTRWKPLQYWKGEHVVVTKDNQGEIETNATRTGVDTPMLKKFRNSGSATTPFAVRNAGRKKKDKKKANKKKTKQKPKKKTKP